MKKIHHCFLLLTLALTFTQLLGPSEAIAGQITFGCGGATSLANVAPDTIAVLNYVAQNVDHDICVVSAYRSPSYNSGVGGASQSQHTRGKAIDLRANNLTDNQRAKLVHTILSHPSVKGFGYYSNSHSLHFDTRPARTGKGYWGYNYSYTGFDADARAGKIHSVIVGMVYRWSNTGSPGEMGTGDENRLPSVTAPTAPVGDCPNFNVPLDPNSAEGLSLLGSTDTNTQSCALQRIGTWQAQNPGQVGTQVPTTIPGSQPPPVPPNTVPSFGGTTPGGSSSQVNGSGSQVFPQYPLPGSQPSALSPTTRQPNQQTRTPTNQPLTLTPPSSVPQCSATSTPSTAKKLPTMTPSEWDRAVRILHAESGACKLGKNDTNCIKVAETFRNRLIYSLETGRNSCWSTWDRILTFTNSSSCGYFDKIGMGRASRLQAGSEMYKNIEQALFQAVYGGTNLSLGNLHNFTKGYHSNIVDQSSIVPAGENYTYIKQIPRETRVDISKYHFPNCADTERLQSVNAGQQTPPTVPPTQPPPSSQPQVNAENKPNVTQIPTSQQALGPGFQGAGQNFQNGIFPPVHGYNSSPTAYNPYTNALQQSAVAQQQYIAQQNQLQRQQQELLRLQQEDPTRQAELRKQIDALQRSQNELLKQQLEALRQQQQAVQRKPSGDRTVTVLAAPNMDMTGVVLTALAGKLQQSGHDIIILPDSINYQMQLDKVIAAIRALPPNTKVNCVGWTKGALGCIALNLQLAAHDLRLHDLVLIDPSDAMDGSSVPGVTASDFAGNKITITVNGKIILYLPESGSPLFVDAGTGVEAVNVNEVRQLPSGLGQLSFGIDADVQNEIAAKLADGDEAGRGNLYNIDLGVSVEPIKKTVGLEGLLYPFRLSEHDQPLFTPIVLLHWIGQSIGSLFAKANDTQDLTVATDELNQDLYLLLIQEMLFGSAGYETEDTESDVTISALRATRTLSDQYRFIGSIERKYSGADADQLRDIDEYFDATVANELLIDLNCDGSIDDGATFITPYSLVRPTPDGAEVTVSEYLPIEEEGLHCFAFVTDSDNVLTETNEDNNFSEWREFVAGFGATEDTPTEDLPPLKFEVSAYSADNSQLLQDWTNENITIAAGQQIAFRWDAPAYDVCSPLLSSLSADILDNMSPAARNTLTEKIDLEERTGYYEIRCEVNGDTKIETIHVTVE